MHLGEKKNLVKPNQLVWKRSMNVILGEETKSYKDRTEERSTVEIGQPCANTFKDVMHDQNSRIWNARLYITRRLCRLETNI